jgi:AcrR family transcriptional regulator
MSRPSVRPPATTGREGRTTPAPTSSPTLTPRRRRQGPSKGDLKEAAILDTAWRLLGQKPISAITVDELASGAGISRSTFYFYFDGRDAVIRALAGRTSSELERTILAVLEAGRPDRASIAAMIRNLLAHWQANGWLLRAMDTMAQHDDELRAFWTGITERVVGHMAAGIDRERASGAALPGPPDSLDLAWALTDMYWRAAQQASLDPPSKQKDQRLVETLTIVTLRALYGGA